MPLRIRPRINISNLIRVSKNLRDNVILGHSATIAEQIFVDMSPVDLGVLRANFFVSYNNTSKKFNKNKTAVEPTDINNSRIKNEELFVINNIPYALFVDKNSISVPVGYIARTVNTINMTLNGTKFINFLRRTPLG